MSNLARYRLVILSVFVLFLCVGAYAQQNSVITGSVTDKEGAVVSGAEVIATHTATGYQSHTVTNDAGPIQSIPALNVGTYDLKVTAKGFQTSTVRGLELNISQTLRQDASPSA